MDKEAGAALIMFRISFIFFITALVMIYSRAKIFKKAGYPGSYVFMPYTGGRTMIKEIAGMDDNTYKMMFIPFINFIYLNKVFRGLAKAFGKSDRYAAIMSFFPFFLYPSLAFGSCKFVGNPEKKSI